ncbi:MAG: UDP-N-acetylmuramoyl-L-alanyl-D-glutamate--2,6-diaminopimelate ligase [Candidatus Omnitrophica bacterium]|nr:UDP-N-acetylmuramoyl-L-alanyl-D-glutamate--2,6-diaminopimelate ligase [Candidatus Omnitrophota bacterium]
MKWRLPELLAASGIQLRAPVPDLPIRQVTDDSRAVTKESLFVAIRGERVDGHRFLQQAVERGAGVVFVEEDAPLPPAVVKFRVPATRPLLGPLVHAFWGAPSKSLKVVGVTGTNGKTTVAWLIHHLFEQAGLPSGLIGTICYRVGDSQRPSENTTPGVVRLNQMLREMVALKLKACSMEVSSHSLDQHRTDGIRFSCGVFTNLSPEHLDYHETLERYLQAKLRLFQGLDAGATAVVNRDDPASGPVREAVQGRVVTFGLKEGADFSATEIRASLEETACKVRTPEGLFPVRWRMIGRHNVENLLAAVAAAASCGVPVRQAMAAVESFPGVPGRLERVEMGQPFPVLIDYAHTDGALRSVLEQCRAASPRRILAVFGCGGDRDRTKRPRMGRVAAELADRVIITSDNPRSEDPERIAEEVAAGIQGMTTPCGIILDRREAIRAALEAADQDWLVLIAGKGHEAGQILKDRTIPFDDRVVVRELLSHGPVSQLSG